MFDFLFETTQTVAVDSEPKSHVPRVWWRVFHAVEDRIPHRGVVGGEIPAHAQYCLAISAAHHHVCVCAPARANRVVV
jgi:hypothetical protein